MRSATLAAPDVAASTTRPLRGSKELVRRFFVDVLTRQCDEAIDALIAPDAAIHLPIGRFHGPDAVRRANAQLHWALSDMHVEITTIIAEGDQVATEWTLCGVEEGELLGVPPSGRRTCRSGLSLTRVAGNQIVEHRMIEE